MALEYDITGTHRTNYLLSIGINEYAQDAIPNLNNARLDAETFSKILTEKYLFESSNTTLLLDKDATREKIIDHLEAYEEKLTEQDNLIIFFSGHGEMKRGGKYGFWVPHDAEKKPSKYVSNERIKGIIDGIKAHHIYLIVDACFSGTMILKKIDSPENELFEKFSSRMALTSGRKEYVSDGWKGEHSPFFKRLKSILENPPKKAFSTLDLEAHVLPDRFASSNQSPLAGPLNSDDHNWGRFVFYSRDLIKREEPTHTKFNDLRRPRAKDYKKIIKELREEQFISAYTQAIYDVYIELKLNIHIEAFTAQIQSYFDLEKDRQVKENLAEWERNSKAEFIRKYGEYGPLVKRVPKNEVKVKKERKVPLGQPTFDFPVSEMIFVKGGLFMMGSKYYRHEKPIHEVNIPDFYMGKYQVTQKEWEAITGTNPSHFKGENLPVENVSWFDAQAYIQKLNEKTGLKFHLPSEAQWEYAARGGQQSQGFKYAGGNKLNEVAWWDNNSNGETHTVGKRKPNELGLYDMSGNVWEWCQDHWNNLYKAAPGKGGAWMNRGKKDRRVVRGGSWFNFLTNYFRVFYRNSYRSYYHDSFIGFRLCRYIT